MRKLCFLFLLFCGLELYAQKQYVTIYADPATVKDVTDYGQRLTGEISEIINKCNELKSLGLDVSIDVRSNNRAMAVFGLTLGELLNILAEEGFEIDQSMLINNNIITLIMYRTKPSDSSAKKMKKGDVNEDENVDISDVVSVINIMAGE